MPVPKWKWTATCHSEKDRFQRSRDNSGSAGNNFFSVKTFRLHFPISKRRILQFSLLLYVFASYQSCICCIQRLPLIQTYCNYLCAAGFEPRAFTLILIINAINFEIRNEKLFTVCYLDGELLHKIETVLQVLYANISKDLRRISKNCGISKLLVFIPYRIFLRRFCYNMSTLKLKGKVPFLEVV